MIETPDLDLGDGPELGPCCICETESSTVRNIIMLAQKAPVSGTGWGCLVCGLPADGAVVVLCDGCYDTWRAGEAALRFACAGYPADGERVAVAELAGEHEHDLEKHTEVMAPFSRN